MLRNNQLNKTGENTHEKKGKTLIKTDKKCNKKTVTIFPSTSIEFKLMIYSYNCNYVS